MHIYIYICIHTLGSPLRISMPCRAPSSILSSDATSGVPVYMCVYVIYGVATVSRIDTIIGLFCRIASLLWGSFATETYNLINPTHHSHPICVLTACVCHMPYAWHDPSTWSHMCDVTHSHTWHDLFACVTWLIHLELRRNVRRACTCGCVCHI